jgi:hypothetical protein
MSPVFVADPLDESVGVNGDPGDRAVAVCLPGECAAGDGVGDVVLGNHVFSSVEWRSWVKQSSCIGVLQCLIDIPLAALRAADVFEAFDHSDFVGGWEMVGRLADCGDDGFDLFKPSRDDGELSLLARGDGERVTHTVGCCACNVCRILSSADPSFAADDRPVAHAHEHGAIVVFRGR